MKKKKLIIIVSIIIIVAGMIAAGTIYYFTQSDLVYKEVYIEAGANKPVVEEFLKHEAQGAKFAKGSNFDTNKPGDYKLKIQWKMPIFGKQNYSTVLHVQDTVKPKVEAAVESIEMYTTADVPAAADFIESVEDATNCTIDYEKKYDFSKAGSFDVKIHVKDEGGNETKVVIPCTVVGDTTAPEITGVEPLVIAQGDAVTYKKNVKVTDDRDPNPTLEVDSSQVNVDKRGIYTVKYIAKDAAGNKSEKETTVRIVSAKIAEATEEKVNELADQVIAQIITPGMDQKAQAKAVFNWVVDNITYSETAGIDDLYSAAYKGMAERVGDCTVKQRTAEVLLNRLGIKNMEIEKIRDTRGHYWLLIDVGEGWYHYDPNLQLDGTLIFYWHDADLWAYSNAHKNTHNYDPSKYPTIQ